MSELWTVLSGQSAKGEDVSTCKLHLGLRLGTHCKSMRIPTSSGSDDDTPQQN